MSIITISRQLGSLGDEVAQAIAKNLEYRLVGREVINKAAVRAGVPEVALAVIDDLGLLGLRPTDEARQAYHKAVSTILNELADEGGVVLVGRAGQVVLATHPDALHVKVISPVALRTGRIARVQKISLEAARAQIETSDRARRDYVRRYYHVRWDDPELYDLILNTARLGPEEAACLVSQALTSCLCGTPSE